MLEKRRDFAWHHDYDAIHDVIAVTNYPIPAPAWNPTPMTSSLGTGGDVMRATMTRCRDTKSAYSTFCVSPPSTQHLHNCPRAYHGMSRTLIFYKVGFHHRVPRRRTGLRRS